MSEVRAWHLLVAAVFITVALSAASCGDTPSPTPTSPPTSASITYSGIDGLMTIEGGPSGDPRPKGDVRIEVRRGDGRGDLVATTRSGADGGFSLDLAPGHYTVLPVPTGDEGVLRASVTVDTGERARVHVGFFVR